MNSQSRTHMVNREAMEQRSKELEARLRNREGLHIEHTADLLDNLQLAANREAEVNRVVRDSNELHLVRRALEAVDTGTYGECQDCGDKISSRRLAVMPWALRCVSCQEKFEEEEGFNPQSWHAAVA